MNKIILAALITTVSITSFAAFAYEAAKPAEPVAAPAAAPAAALAAVKEEVKTVAGELKDGTKIEITGDKVEVVGKDGKKSPAPDGEHTLKDDSKVTTKGGMIVKK
ncbi:MAG: hypothetical protein ABL867_04625 [Rickettsiales bacterium]